MVTLIQPKSFNVFLMLIQVRVDCLILVLSDPKKRQYYDKYGTVDEDNFNFEEFMKGFSFDNIFEMFDDNFGKKVINFFYI